MSIIPRGEGLCRICYDVHADGQELIAPCACKGSVRWIHRSCLDQWRASGVNPRNMSHCPNCGCQYTMKLIRAATSDIEERQRKFLMLFGSMGVGAFLGVQLVIMGLGMIVRHFDDKEKLVRVFGFPQDPGHAEPGSFRHAVHHHKCTYYVAGALVFLAVLGLVSVVVYSYQCCCGVADDMSHRRGYQHGAYGGNGCELCCADCGAACQEGCSCNHCCGACPGAPSAGAGSGCEEMPIIFLILLVVLIVIGVFMMIVGVVLSIQAASRRWARLQQMRFLATEYYVQDLAEDELSKEPRAEVMGEVTAVTCDAEVQRQLSRDLDRIFANAPQQPGARRATGYGAA